jgi:hypothetical protein
VSRLSQAVAQLRLVQELLDKAKVEQDHAADVGSFGPVQRHTHLCRAAVFIEAATMAQKAFGIEMLS